MSKKNIILLILIVVLIGFGTYITLLYFNINSSNSSDNIVNYSDEVYTIENLPIDNDYTDNLKLYGGWESEKIEVYRDNELSSTIMDNSGVLQIYNNLLEMNCTVLLPSELSSHFQILHIRCCLNCFLLYRRRCHLVSSLLQTFEVRLSSMSASCR